VGQKSASGKLNILIRVEMTTTKTNPLTDDGTVPLVTGFCWLWSSPDSSGQLVDDVKLNGFSMPWNAMPDAGKLALGIPKSNFWASDPNGINQVGCVYTAQGF
jgi:hypothetical protein